MFNIFDIAWYKCNFKTYGKSVVSKLQSGKTVKSLSEFEDQFGKVIIDKCHFDGAYNGIISDAYESKIVSKDNFLFFITEDNTLWIKCVGCQNGTKWRVCGLLIGYVLSQVCKQDCYKKIYRLGTIYPYGQTEFLEISSISDTIFNNVCRELIGYLPVSDKSRWRESQGTNVEKLNILFDYWKNRLPADVTPPTMDNMITPVNDICTQLLLPETISEELSIYKRAEYAFKMEDYFAPHIQYISDIHIDYPGKLDESLMDKELNRICKKLARSAKSKTVIIAGDTAGSIALAQKFFHKLRMAFVYCENNRKARFITPAMSEDEAYEAYNKLEKQMTEKLERAAKRVEGAKKHFGLKRSVEWLLSNGSMASMEKYSIVIAEYRKWKSVKDKLASMSEVKEEFIQSLQKEEKISTIPSHDIYVVLGNHEFSEFDTVDEAVLAYRDMLSKEKINFLHNEVVYRNDFFIIGGTGFAKFNEKHNANTLIGAKTMDREAEIVESEKFFQEYSVALEKAKVRKVPIVVITHYPTKDWLPNNAYDSFAYYVWGHNHRNYSHQKDGINVLANNQIGYEGKNIVFKDGYIGTIRNPFIDYKDGCYEIPLVSYTQFMAFSGKSVSGTSILERSLSKPEARLYMIKAAGFYGFFILTKNDVAKICYGGKTTNIEGTKGKNIDYFFQYFIIMAKLQVGAFGNYYKSMKEISNEVKKLGFSGKIHGCIIDIDFYNHIMVNPLDGKLTFYYSPQFGIVKAYDSFEQLLQDSLLNSLESKKYITATDGYNRLVKSGKGLITQTKVSLRESKLQKVSTKSGAYATSNRMNRIQFFVEAGVLNTWSTKAIEDFISDIDLLKEYK